MSAARLKSLEKAAIAAMQQAYAPYSNYHVGAALLAKSGRVYTGVNVENRSYGLTICAERNAIAQAVNAGEREFVHLVVATVSSPPAPPCGACREVLAEFAPSLPITLVNTQGAKTEHSLDLLLPSQFVFKPKKSRR